MKQVSKKQLEEILATFPQDASDQNWSRFTEKNGRGDYGYDDTYCYNKKPIFKLSIAFVPPFTVAYDLREVSQ